MTSHRILLGLGLGILTGIFLGEQAAIFGIAADAFVKLLQMTVLPLVVVSLVAGIGTLTHDQVGLLGRRTVSMLALLWCLGLAFVLLFPLTLPTTVSASFFSTTLIEPQQPFNFVDLYIPANPFRSLADNVVPAVVLFSVTIGVALIGVAERHRLIEILRILRTALSQVTTYVVWLTPYGLFTIAAHAAGTLTIDQISRVKVYVIAYSAMSLLISLWVLPGLITLVTGIPYLTLLRSMRNALITAFTTSSLFVVLPLLIDQAKLLAREHGIAPDAQGTPDVLVPVSFNFPHIGKVLTLSFVPFAGWYSGAPLTLSQFPQLAATGLFVMFGSVDVGVPFLLDLFRIPADTFQLFLAMGVINSHFGTAMATMHTAAVAVIGTWLVANHSHVTLRRLIRYAITTLLLTVLTLAAIRWVSALGGLTAYQGDRVLLGMRMLHESGPVEVRPGGPFATPLPASSSLTRIRDRGVLRVGIVPDSLPFVFINSYGEVVGFDVEMAHKLARELGVGLELVWLERAGFAAALDRGVCDVVMSGLFATTARAAAMTSSKPYLDETLAFVVPDHARAGFATWEAVRRRGHLRIGTPPLSALTEKLHNELPDAEIVLFSSAEDIFGPGRPSLDAVLLSAERGSAWTLLHPELSVVVPMPRPVQVPLAYPTADAAMAEFMDTWIDLAQKDGTIQALYEHWILGRTAMATTPRWSVIRNVLHWVD